jgi:ubiquinol-cytochrome c reductase cytochrome b subunit
MTDFKKSSGLFDWFDQRLHLKELIRTAATEYWIPKKINFLWSFGLVLAVLFAVLIVSGIFLLMYYKPDTQLAFHSVNYTIMQEVSYGWLFRHLHAVAASVIFLALFIHLFTAIYYGSYKAGRELVWLSGALLLMAFSAAGFSGYMLPWGQMSYWAAQVITSIFGSIPVIGPDLVIWIRGDYVVGDATLTRFFALHVFVIPLVIVGIIGLHIYAVRIPHVNNEEGETLDFDAESAKFTAGDKTYSKVIPFWPTFVAEDVFVIGVFFTFFFYLVFFHFEFALDPINFIPADTLKTPAHIYPEWYFLWSYEILRGFFFSSSLGLIAFGIANLIFLFFPWLDRDPLVRPMSRRPLMKWWFWSFLTIMVALTVFGKLPPTGVNAYIGCLLAVSWLAWVLVLLPLLSSMERKQSMERQSRNGG